MVLRKCVINTDKLRQSKFRIDDYVKSRVHNQIISHIQARIKKQSMKHNEEIYFGVTCTGRIVAVADRTETTYFRLLDGEHQEKLDVVVKFDKRQGNHMYIPPECDETNYCK